MQISGHFQTGESSFFVLLMAERDEIMRLKWIESEKAGYDIGWDAAYWKWNMQYRTGWFAVIRSSEKLDD